jgi:carbon-monoxide dehydrogenase small subunit
MRISMTVNGAPVTEELDPGELLVDFLRGTLGLTGTKIGCETGQCGSCVVNVGGRSAKSCLMLAAQADGAEVVTIEGVAGDGRLTDLQAAMWDEHATQCGFCTPGMVMSLSELLERVPKPTEQDIRQWLTGNLCRCTGYQSIVRGLRRASAMAGERAAGAE